jgi:hypothetical protein
MTLSAMITIFCTVVLSIDPGSSTLTQVFHLGKRWGVTATEVVDTQVLGLQFLPPVNIICLYIPTQLTRSAPCLNALRLNSRSAPL